MHFHESSFFLGFKYRFGDANAPVAHPLSLLYSIKPANFFYIDYINAIHTYTPYQWVKIAPHPKGTLCRKRLEHNPPGER